MKFQADGNVGPDTTRYINVLNTNPLLREHLTMRYRPPQAATKTRDPIKALLGATLVVPREYPGVGIGGATALIANVYRGQCELSPWISSTDLTLFRQFQAQEALYAAVDAFWNSGIRL